LEITALPSAVDLISFIKLKDAIEHFLRPKDTGLPDYGHVAGVMGLILWIRRFRGLGVQTLINYF
jgi:hypothetical protein